MPFICSPVGDNGIMGCHEILRSRSRAAERPVQGRRLRLRAGRQDLNASGLCAQLEPDYNVCRTGSAQPPQGRHQL